MTQGNGRHQDDGGLSIPWFLLAALAIVLDLKGPREEEPSFLSELFFCLKEASHEELAV